MHDDILSMLQPKIDEFRQLRLESGLDSVDLFTNSFLDEIIFYDVDRPSAGRLRSGAEGMVMRGGAAGGIMLFLLAFLMIC